MGWGSIPGWIVPWVGDSFLDGLCHGLEIHTWMDCAMGWRFIPGLVVPWVGDSYLGGFIPARLGVLCHRLGIHTDWCIIGFLNDIGDWIQCGKVHIHT